MRAMKRTWRERLIEAIERDGRTPRAISLAAGLGANYLGQMFERGTSPSTPALVSLCDTLGVSLTYIFTEARMTPEEEELLRISANLSDRQKSLLLDLARQLGDDEQH